MYQVEAVGAVSLLFARLGLNQMRPGHERHHLARLPLGRTSTRLQMLFSEVEFGRLSRFHSLGLLRVEFREWVWLTARRLAHDDASLLRGEQARLRTRTSERECADTHIDARERFVRWAVHHQTIDAKNIMSKGRNKRGRT